MKQTKTTYDVLFAADHFVMVTTVEMPASPDRRDIEEQAWYRLTEVYGATWVLETKGFVNQVSIQEVEPLQLPGDLSDAGLEEE